MVPVWPTSALVLHVPWAVATNAVESGRAALPAAVANTYRETKHLAWIRATRGFTGTASALRGAPVNPAQQYRTARRALVQRPANLVQTASTCRSTNVPVSQSVIKTPCSGLKEPEQRDEYASPRATSQTARRAELTTCFAPSALIGIMWSTRNSRVFLVPIRGARSAAGETHVMCVEAISTSPLIAGLVKIPARMGRTAQALGC